jgi:arsenate reductase
MAEAFLRKYAGDLFEVHSAGLDPKPIHPQAVQVMDEVGMDIFRQTSKGIEKYSGKPHFEYLITVCDDANRNCPEVLPDVNTRMHWSFEDPTAWEGSDEETLAKFRKVRDLIERKIIGWVARKIILSPAPIRVNLYQ